jgi:hypothetical protein
MTVRRNKQIMVIIFLIMISLPVLFLNHNPSKILVIENRVVAKPPMVFRPDGSININRGFFLILRIT